MSENVDTLVPTQLCEIREEQRAFREQVTKDCDEVCRDITELRSMIGGQGVILTSLPGYVHQVEEPVEKLEGHPE